MPGPEAKLSMAVRQVLELHGIHVYSTETKGIRGPSGVSPGIADLIVLDTLRQKIAFVELKSGRGQLTLHQQAFGNRVRDSGGEALVWRNVADCLSWIGQDRVVEALDDLPPELR